MQKLEELRNLKGTKDFLPEDQLIRNFIMDTLKGVFELYGFLPLETPILCSYDLLASKYAGGAEILKEVYKLTDQGKRQLGLRYDLTVPFAKVIATNQELSLPFRRYEIGKVFRDGPVKLGRSREFYQCDVDVCGIAGNDVEVELFDMILEGYKRLGLEVELIWNNRKFLSGLMQECGIAEQLVAPAILSVDKLEKVGQKNVEKELVDAGIEQSKIDQLFEWFALDFAGFEALFANTQNELLQQGLTEVARILELIKALGLSKNTRFVPFLARGLEIYTGTVWEVLDKSGIMSSSLGGGGRYDNIIANFVDNGQAYPAVGTSFGLEPIFELLKQKAQMNFAKNKVYIYPFELKPKVFQIAKQLRMAGLEVVLELNKLKLKKALPWAEKQGINHVLILGDDELDNNVVSYKNLAASTQETLPILEFVEKLKK